MQPVKFTFDTEFDTGRSRRKPALPAAPSYSQGAFDAAVAAAAARGREQGRQDAQAETAAALAAATTRLEAGLAEVRAALAARDGRLETEAARLGHAIAGRLCQALSARLPLAEIEALVAAILHEVGDEPRLTIHVAEELAEAARERFAAAARAASFQGEFTVTGDPGMRGGDCRVAWAQGSAMRDAEALTRAVDAAVDGYIAALPQAKEL